MSSIRLRLLVSLVALLALAAAAMAAITYRNVLGETEAIFDYQLQQMALSLRDQGEIASAQADSLADEQLDFVIQIWTIDGRTIYASRAHASLPARALLGLHTLDRRGPRLAHLQRGDARARHPGRPAGRDPAAARRPRRLAQRPAAAADDAVRRARDLVAGGAEPGAARSPGARACARATHARSRRCRRPACPTRSRRWRSALNALARAPAQLARQPARVRRRCRARAALAADRAQAAAASCCAARPTTRRRATAAIERRSPQASTAPRAWSSSCSPLARAEPDAAPRRPSASISVAIARQAIAETLHRWRTIAVSRARTRSPPRRSFVAGERQRARPAGPQPGRQRRCAIRRRASRVEVSVSGRRPAAALAAGRRRRAGHRRGRARARLRSLLPARRQRRVRQRPRPGDRAQRRRAHGASIALAERARWAVCG